MKGLLSGNPAKPPHQQIGIKFLNPQHWLKTEYIRSKLGSIFLSLRVKA